MGQGIYQIIVLMLLLVFGRDWFNLPYKNNWPLYADEDWLTAELAKDPLEPGIDGLSVNDATNKCTVYTIVF